MSEQNKPEETKIPKPLFLYMLISISVVLDFFGYVLFALSFVGVGIPLSFILDGIGSISSFILNNSQRVSDVKWALSETVKLKDSFSSTRSNAGGKNQSNIMKSILSKINQMMISEKLKNVFFSILMTAIATIIELIPFIGDISPTYTLAVIVILRKRSNSWGKFSKQINKVKDTINKMKGKMSLRGVVGIGSIGVSNYDNK